MVEKSEPEDDVIRTSYSSSNWPRIIAMFGSIGLVAVVFTLVAIFNKSFAPKPNLPHIIFILVDDLGWNDISFHGSPQIPTPNIDALAASGVILNNYYTYPQCTPSRGALMTGKYAKRLGLQHGNLRPAEASGLPLNMLTLADYLKRRTYKTHLIGKWHLGYHTKHYLPTSRGFDTFFGFLNDNIDYFDYTCYYKEVSANNQIIELFGVDLWENREVVTDLRGEYATDVFTQKALAVIDQHNVSKPLFLLLSHAATHTGNSFYPLQSTVDMFERNNHIKDEKRRTYAGMLSALDDSVGKVFDALYQKDMLTNTIVILSSDNGGDPNSGSASNWPLRGSKFTLWEGGIRSVGVVWSSLLDLDKPRVSKQLMHISDWLPTLYYVTGGDISELVDIDGVNMWPAIAHGNKESPREEILLNVDSLSGIAGFRKGDMKLHVSTSIPNASDWYGPSGLEDTSNVTSSFDDWVWKNGSRVKDILTELEQWLITENDTWRQDATIICGENFLPVSGKCDFTNGPCLYNITEDPCEYKNIAYLYPEIVDALLNRLNELNATSLPPQTKDIDPMGDPICHDFVYMPWAEEEITYQIL